MFSMKIMRIFLSDDHDTVYFAHCYPFTYSQLCRFLRNIENEPANKMKFKRKTLCQTVAGNKFFHKISIFNQFL